MPYAVGSGASVPIGTITNPKAYDQYLGAHQGYNAMGQFVGMPQQTASPMARAAPQAGAGPAASAASSPVARSSMPGSSLYSSGSFGGGSTQSSSGGGSNQGSSSSTSSTQMVPGMQGVYNQLLGINQQRYGNVLNAYQSQLGGNQETLGAIQGGYSNLGQATANTMGMGQILGQDGNWGVAQAGADDIKRTYDFQRGQLASQMVDSGLSNTTVKGNASNQLTMQQGMAYKSLAQGLARDYAGMQSQIGQAGLGAATQGVGLQSGLTQGAFGPLGQAAANTAGSLTGSFGNSTSQQSGNNFNQGGGQSQNPSYGPPGGYKYPEDPNFPSGKSGGGAGGGFGGGGGGYGGGGINSVGDYVNSGGYPTGGSMYGNYGGSNGPSWLQNQYGNAQGRNTGSGEAPQSPGWPGGQTEQPGQGSGEGYPTSDPNQGLYDEIDRLQGASSKTPDGQDLPEGQSFVALGTKLKPGQHGDPWRDPKTGRTKGIVVS